MPPWKEPIQIQRGDQSGDPEDARSSLLHLHLPGHQDPAESGRGLPRLEVCGPSPGCVDPGAAGERSHFFQGAWWTFGFYTHATGSITRTVQSCMLFLDFQRFPCLSLSSWAYCLSGALRRTLSSCKTSNHDSGERRRPRRTTWKAHGETHKQTQ